MQQSRSTYQALAQRLLGGKPHLSANDVATRTDLSLYIVQGFWRALGFADSDADKALFTDDDVRLIEAVAAAVNGGKLSLTAAQTLTRAQGHSADRLALWQVEALVEDAASRFDLDDTSARLVVLDTVAQLAPLLEHQLVHTWRRQLVALLGRLDREVSTAHMPTVPHVGQLPLERAVGFIDMISFTERTAAMPAQELADLVQGFETAARDTLAAHGARVVKTIGDAVLYVADDLLTGADVSLALLEVMARDGFDVRGALVWGRVLSRSGDIFGPSVNLASRLGDVAPDGAMVLDDVSAALLEAIEPSVSLTPLAPVVAQGLGVVRPVQLRRTEAIAKSDMGNT